MSLSSPDIHFTNDVTAADRAAPAIRGEQALWRAVILQALEDAASKSGKPQERYHKTQALHWLEGTSAEFRMVCDFAGFDVQAVRKKIKRALLNDCKWRAEAGKAPPKRRKPETEHNKAATTHKTLQNAGAA